MLSTAKSNNVSVMWRNVSMACEKEQGDICMTKEYKGDFHKMKTLCDIEGEISNWTN